MRGHLAELNKCTLTEITEKGKAKKGMKQVGDRMKELHV
jgi:hypothetical protein